jgi:hypothetical protein
MDGAWGNRKHVRRGLLIAAIATALLGAVTATAAEAPTRDDYVNQLEDICKPDALATQRVMKGVRADMQAERIAVAATKFARATSIFGSTVREITAVLRPPADTSRLSKWFARLKKQLSYLRQITAQLRQDHPRKAQKLLPYFIHNGNLANHVVLAFEFDYCSFKFSRYG